MTHEKFQDLLGDYAEGMLPVGAMTAFRQHLESCPSCAALTDAYTSAVADLHAFPRLEVPEGFTLRILERTTRRPSPVAALAAWLGLPRFRLNPAAAGALCSLLLVLVLGTSEGKRVARELNMDPAYGLAGNPVVISHTTILVPTGATLLFPTA